MSRKDKYIDIHQVFKGPGDLSGKQMQEKLKRDAIEKLVQAGLTREKAELAFSSGAIKIDVTRIR